MILIRWHEVKQQKTYVLSQLNRKLDRDLLLNVFHIFDILGGKYTLNYINHFLFIQQKQQINKEKFSEIINYCKEKWKQCNIEESEMTFQNR